MTHQEEIQKARKELQWKTALYADLDSPHRKKELLVAISRLLLLTTEPAPPAGTVERFPVLKNATGFTVYSDGCDDASTPALPGDWNRLLENPFVEGRHYLASIHGSCGECTRIEEGNFTALVDWPGKKKEEESPPDFVVPWITALQKRWPEMQVRKIEGHWSFGRGSFDAETRDAFLSLESTNGAVLNDQYEQEINYLPTPDDLVAALHHHIGKPKRWEWLRAISESPLGPGVPGSVDYGGRWAIFLETHTVRINDDDSVTVLTPPKAVHVTTLHELNTELKRIAEATKKTG